MKKILYIDMDGVLVDFDSAKKHYSKEFINKYKYNLDEIDGFFSKMIPMENAIESFNKLCDVFDVYILSTASYNNPSAWSDKLVWVKKYLGDKAHKRLILSHNKHLNVGDYLIDDRLKNGADKFTGELIHFGKEKFKNWNDIIEYLI